MDEEKNNMEVVTHEPVTKPESSSSIERRSVSTSKGKFGSRGGRFNRRGGQRSRPPAEKQEFDAKPIDIARVARVTKGGKRFSFRTTVVIGDGKGRIGIGIGKGRDVAQSIQKGTNQAKKHLFTVPIVNGTIPYQTEAKYCSAQVILKPAKGGVKAGGPVRVVAKLAGITGLSGKLIGRTNNKLNISMAALCALRKLKNKNKTHAAPQS